MELGITKQIYENAKLRFMIAILIAGGWPEPIGNCHVLSSFVNNLISLRNMK